MSCSRDLYNNIKNEVAIAPQLALAADVTGAAIDTKGFLSLAFVAQSANVTGGPPNMKMQESEDGSTGWTDVGKNDVLPFDYETGTGVVTLASGKIGYVGDKRFVRLVVIANGATAYDIAAQAILGDPEIAAVGS